MFLHYKSSFKKDVKKSPKAVQEKLKERLKLFQNNPFATELNNHKLRGKYADFSSINITGDLRALFFSDGESATFVRLDNHNNLYGR